MPSAPKAYLAGPTVFFPDAREVGHLLKRLCQDHGLIGVFPLDELGPGVTAREIFDHNIARLRVCDIVVADVSPFRGPHADDGTAFEMGFANALALPIFAYSRDVRPLASRIATERGHDRRLRDDRQLEVEDFGLNQNLMLSCAVVGVYESAAKAIEAAAQHLSAT
ncbi:MULTISPECIES: nucleoside 2-deoxyribosyltransferase [unclassified Bradyrhizobium]|uniref:nucleoside 2-deoxyribosyltransferase n=1 Tax=unclassified Bradyrhizobium TaxID=2631580 RepID=UPI0033945CE2